MSASATPFLALACVGFIASAPALADPVVAQDQVADRDDIVVNGRMQPAAPEVETPKSTAPIVDTPQTITIVSEQTIRKQNLQTLRDVLQTVPGITFGAGEGGGGYGDSINLRGYSANNDITVDGVRDSAQYSRTDPFNLQQIEVYNGANSVFNGSGSVGGTINLVSKVPTPDTLTIVQGSVGTDDYYRAAIDSNVRATETIAVRLNGAYHRNDVPGRDVEAYERWGVAPSVTLGMGGPTSLTIAFVHQEDRNTPVFGVPYVRGPVTAGPLPGVDRSDYFGIVNLDRQDTTVDRLTATFRHDFGGGLSVRNLTRWQRVGQYSVTSAPQGTFCLADGLQPVGAGPTATTGLACPATLRPGQYQPSGPRGFVRDQENQLLYNQTDIRLVSGREGGVRNTLVVGVSGMLEDYAITTASLIRDASGVAVPLPVIDLFDPDTTYTGPVNYTVTAQSEAETRNAALYAFDTIELGRAFELNGGVRYEFNRASFRALPLASTPPGTVPLTVAQRLAQVSDEELFSWHVGAVWHPADGVSVYGGYGNSKTPSSATVRLGCGAISAAPGGAVIDPCAVAPETARNYEVGVKAGLLGDRLLLTAAVFRNERTNFRVASNDPVAPALQTLDGRSRVDGVALGISGNITTAWTVFANYTYLDGKVRQGVSDFCRVNVGTTGCGNSAALVDPQAGSRLIQTPDHSGSLFTTYRLPFGLELGYGLTYQGSFALNAPTILQPRQFRAEDYLIHRAYLAYTFGGGLTAQLNVQNFTDETYYATIRNNLATTGAVSGGWAAPGDRRQATLSLFYSF